MKQVFVCPWEMGTFNGAPDGPKDQRCDQNCSSGPHDQIRLNLKSSSAYAALALQHFRACGVIRRHATSVFRAFRTEAFAQGADDVPYVVGGSERGYGDVIS